MAKKKQRDDAIDRIMSGVEGEDAQDTSQVQDSQDVLTYNGRTDLPPELIAQLALRTGGRGPGETSLAILDVVNKATQPLTLNDIIVGVYDATGNILKRKNVYVKLGRLVKSGAIAAGTESGTYMGTTAPRA